MINVHGFTGPQMPLPSTNPLKFAGSWVGYGLMDYGLVLC